MDNKNYINIQGWMINNLKLKGNELILYAIIYGFSQDGESEYYGSQRYIAKALGVSVPTVNKTIKKLLDKNLIKNTSESHYKAVSVKKSLTEGVKESLTPVLKKVKQGVKESLTIGVKESLTNNNNTNNKNNNKLTMENFSLFWKDYPNKKNKQKALLCWKKLKPDKELQKKIISALLEQKKSEGWTKDGGRFIPHPSTWLNNKRWEDEIEKPKGVKVFKFKTKR